MSAPRVGIVMGSTSDLPVMRQAADALDELGVPHEVRVVSAHRMPRDMIEYGAGAADRGLRVIVAGAGGAAHLPGMLAAVTAILITARNGIGDAGLSRSGLEFDVIAAVVIGGTSLSGGRGSVIGTLLGIFIISLIGNGLVLLGIDSFLQPVVRGVIIVAAVLLNILAGRYNARSNLKA